MSIKLYSDAGAAFVSLLSDGMTTMAGGFGLSGKPEHLIPAIKVRGVRHLTGFFNHCGAELQRAERKKT